MALYTAQNLPVAVPQAKPSVKAGKIECVQCHDLSKKQTLENLSSACTQCHDQAYADLVKGLKAETLEIQKKAKDLLDRVDKKLIDAKKAKQKIGEAEGLLARGKKAYEFVILAKGIHNIDLAGVILEQAQKDAKKAEELLASSRR
jgi:formate-dependent nitrite reductase cytochrome c552 subunit